MRKTGQKGQENKFSIFDETKWKFMILKEHINKSMTKTTNRNVILTN